MRLRLPFLGVQLLVGAAAVVAPTDAFSKDAASKDAPAKDVWVAHTSSPKPGTVNDPKDAPLVAGCGGGVDATLVVVANELAHVLATRGELPDAQELEWRQRKAGNPHVWPRTWGAHVAGAPLDRATLAKDVTKWLGPNAGRLRCGAATIRVGSGTTSKEAVAVIAIDPMADLAPLPTKTKVGTWIDLDATLLHGSNGRVVLLPPTGAPKTILATTSTVGGLNHVRAKLYVGALGRHVLQVLAEDGAGPRPVLEAEIFAGIEPPNGAPSATVPGEEAGDGVDDAIDALLRRVNGARAAEGTPALVRDPLLEKVARAHALAMMKAKLLGHDVGDGDPAARLVEAGGKWKLVGENVAKAKSERAAHRAIYASPSHRSNVLDARFKKIGIAIVADPKSDYLWVTQLFGG